jgi:formylglycine-generating enzyme required for sulfatase activity
MKTKLGLQLVLLLPAVFIFSMAANVCSADPIKVTDVSGNFTSTIEVIGIVGTSVKVRRSDGSTVEIQLTTFDRDSLIKILIELGREVAPNPKTGNTISNTIGMMFNKIPAGTFMMGSPTDEIGRKDAEETQHKVTITKAFYMQATEVTQGQWKAVMGTMPWRGKSHVKQGPTYAATFVSWNDAIAYCKKLSEKEGKRYRLPTEAEWEYACRAGTDTAWSFGDDEKEIGDYAWYRENAYLAGAQYPHQVGLKEPNAFGLYDMHGNVYEWCHDYYKVDYYKQSPEQDPQGPASSSQRVVRGASWNLGTRDTRTARRTGSVANDRYDDLGFRLVRELD